MFYLRGFYGAEDVGLEPTSDYSRRFSSPIKKLSNYNKNNN